MPAVRTPVPAAVGRAWVERLAGSECPALTTRRKRREEQTGANHDPIVWVEAEGANVIDADGNRYVDLTSGFGVAFVGHRHPDVVRAVKRQADRLLHALGDLHPSDVKIELLERLSALSPWPQARVMLSLSGADAVTAALKTAVMATGKTGVVAFEGSYHGLTYGPLAVSGFAERFRQPFQAQLQRDVQFVPWPRHDTSLDEALRALPRDWTGIGAVIAEPIQGRAGVRLPPAGFLAALALACRQNGALLIVDEIFTGMGRCGAWWRSVDEDVTARRDLHRQSTRRRTARERLPRERRSDGGLGNSGAGGDSHWDFLRRSARRGCSARHNRSDRTRETVRTRCGTRRLLAETLRSAGLSGVREVRHAGLMIGLQLERPMQALTVTRTLLERGYLVLPAGAQADVLQLAPPVMIADAQLDGFIQALKATLEAG